MGKLLVNIKAIYDVGFFGKWPLLKAGSKWEGFASFLVQGRDSLFTEDSLGDLFVNIGPLAGPVDPSDNDQGFVVRETGVKNLIGLRIPRPLGVVVYLTVDKNESPAKV